MPPELQDRRQWVAWGFEWRDEKWTKVPINPATSVRASATDSTTWGTLAEALARMARDGLTGIGYVLSDDGQYTGIDLDGCRDPLTGQIEPWAERIVQDLASFTEPSPSNTGLHVVVRATKPGPRCRRGPVEMYDRSRFLTMIGRPLPGYDTIHARQAELSDLYARTFPAAPGPTPRPVVGGNTLNDDEVIERASSARNGMKFRALWGGDTGGHGGDDSVADLALLSLLSFWTQDPEQLDRLFRQSGLYRHKWERRDYRQRTITRALDGLRDVWTPDHGASGRLIAGAGGGRRLKVREVHCA